MDPQRSVVRLTGRFVFASHREFNDAVERALKTEEPVIVIELSGVTYIDSAALGMLLLARQRADNVGKTVALQGAAGSVLQVLQIANFGKVFAIR